MSDTLRRIATRLIVTHGQPATLLRPGEGTRNDFGEYIPGPDTEYSATVVAATVAVELRFFAGGLMPFTGNRVLVSVDGLAIVPETTDRIRLGGVVLRIVRVTSIAPDGEPILYELEVMDP